MVNESGKRVLKRGGSVSFPLRVGFPISTPAQHQRFSLKGPALFHQWRD